jgi:hypothetical protein
MKKSIVFVLSVLVLWTFFPAAVPASPLRLSCAGFDYPFDIGPVAVRGMNKVLPLTARLFDENGFPITDADIATPPVYRVILSMGTVADPIYVNRGLLPPKYASREFRFGFSEDQRWRLNVSARKFAESAIFTIYMKSGDPGEYVIDPTCSVVIVGRKRGGGNR